MFVLVRAVTWSTLFIGLLLVLVPARIHDVSGLTGPTQAGAVEYAAIALTVLGGALALWCVATFVVVGRGTPAPFDPPRRLVVRGPYKYVRNPMYIGAAVALSGAALYYRSETLFGYAVLFLLGVHSFVVLYEEPTLARLFGSDYEVYCARVSRWMVGI